MPVPELSGSIQPSGSGLGHGSDRAGCAAQACGSWAARTRWCRARRTGPSSFGPRMPRARSPRPPCSRRAAPGPLHATYGSGLSLNQQTLKLWFADAVGASPRPPCSKRAAPWPSIGFWGFRVLFNNHKILLGTQATRICQVGSGLPEFDKPDVSQGSTATPGVRAGHSPASAVLLW